jgi:hypothetical protein
MICNSFLVASYSGPLVLWLAGRVFCDLYHGRLRGGICVVDTPAPPAEWHGEFTFRQVSIISCSKLSSIEFSFSFSSSSKDFTIKSEAASMEPIRVCLRKLSRIQLQANFDAIYPAFKELEKMNIGDSSEDFNFKQNVLSSEMDDDIVVISSLGLIQHHLSLGYSNRFG